MFIRCLIILIFIVTQNPVASAQQSENESDTTILKDLKQYPRRNTLPVRRPIIFPETVRLPEPDSLELSINYWRSWTSFGVNVNQASFSDNWGGGGVNSLAVGGQFSYKTDYTKGDKNFVSEVLLQYGKLKNKGQLSRKPADRIFWDNKIA